MTLDPSEPRLMSAEPVAPDPRQHRLRVPDRVGSVLGLKRRSFHRIAYTDWGPQGAARPVLCVHGLTRNGRDFDHLAIALASGGRRVACPDLPGRGQSQWLKDSSDYVLPQYCGDMAVVIAALGSSEVDWVGTSLGGMIGMVLAALPNNPIRRLVINDIGPYLPWAGLRRLGANLNEAPKGFASVEAAERYFRRVLAPFGELEDAHWRHLTEHSVQWKPERQRFESLCDPDIAHAFRNPWHYSVDLWKYWEAIEIPILVVRGEESDLLTEGVLADMLRRNRHATAHTVRNCGHAPALIAPDQIALVGAFLDSGGGTRR